MKAAAEALLALLLSLPPSLACRDGTTGGPLAEAEWDDASLYKRLPRCRNVLKLIKKTHTHPS